MTTPSSDGIQCDPGDLTRQGHSLVSIALYFKALFFINVYSNIKGEKFYGVAPVVSCSRTDTDLTIKMKFLILALCVCAANAAAAYKPWQLTNFGVKPETPVVPVVPAVKSASVKPIYKPEYKPVVPVAPVVPVSKTASSYIDSDVPILGYYNNYNPETQDSSSSFETANGIVVESNGALKRVGDIDAYAFQGSYRYISPEGIPVEVNYVADENGYQPKSDLIPQAPPVPEAIARSLEYIASRPQYIEPVKKF
ncbi:hypothetical protein K1T71_004491 [Dendrolimus kikuchii]|uniref:Uncharacterized protein n=1 Tax=Dendrolimus kikuchii TaxID=765133 RepID=A0ACC1D7V3_9NEOP|nr:hypothetical protein K1T71_004491 [Dendrolimus kikuchii]